MASTQPRRKFRRRTKVLLSIGVVVVVLLGLVGAGALVVTAPRPDFPTADKPTRNSWYQADLGTRAMSADGGDYRIYAKTGSSDNLVIFFGGGGVTWDGDSAANPITIGKYLFGGGLGDYFRTIPAYFPTTLQGFLEADNPKNPFNDWNIVVLPYSTGDFHTGNATKTLTASDGTETVMHYNGRTNVSLALDWIQKRMPQPTKLLVAGSSAGGFGSTFWLPEIAAAYPESTVYHFAEGDQLPSPTWPRVAEQLWNSQWQRDFGHEPGTNLYETAVRSNRERLGDRVVFLDSNTVYDDTLLAFTGRVQDRAITKEQWSTQTRASMKRLSETVPDYYFYLTDYGLDEKTGLTPHTFVSQPNFFTATEDGMRFSTWLADAVIRDEPRSVGEKFLR
jgi:hypothetical protein